MKLISSEEVLMNSDSNRMVLTNFRICQVDTILGNEYTNSIFLEDISSVESMFKQKIWLLVAGAIFFLVAVIFRANQIGILAILIALVSLLIWFFTRKHIISIRPNGGAPIHLLANRMRKESIEHFILKISQAKLDRYLMLK